MRTKIGSAKRVPGRKGRPAAMPDGIGGTIAGGPMRPLDLIEHLTRGTQASIAGVAVAGAAQVMVSSACGVGGREPGIALSDGSRIIFASVDHVKILAEA